MPKLDGGSFGTKFGYQIDKQNDYVGFEDSTHTYFDLNDGSKYISVTQLLKCYEPEFNGDFWASYKALEFLMDDQPEAWSRVKEYLLKTKKMDMRILTKYKIDEDSFTFKKQEILDSYNKAGQDAREKGTATHLKKELSFYDEKLRNVEKYGIGGRFECHKGDYKLKDKFALYPELLISYSDGDFKLCGQADLICKMDKRIIIIDWKTSRKIEKKSFYNKNTKKNECLKFPLNHIMSSNYWVYSLQLSCYMWMLQQQDPTLECEKIMIVQIKDDGEEIMYECDYLKDDVEKMIKHYRKQQKIKKELDKIKPIKL